MSESAERTRQVKAQALSLGFDACGIASVAEPIDPWDRLGHWLGRGYQADMGWMAASKDLRQDVTRKLPGVRSVMVVARNYYTPRPEAPEETGRVSRYAWGRDYHRVLKKPLKRLAVFIEDMAAGMSCYASIDSGPVSEALWAERAGIGWIGKHGLVIHPEFGSWIFLATILTTVELAPDTPATDQCGACRCCLDACPTGAIVEPRVVDARRCISYQTIENRGDIPEDVQQAMGDWVYGCDVCQEVCPRNRQAKVTDETDFQPRPGHAHLDLAGLLAMDEEAFLAEFAGTPIMRAKMAGMRRNARIAGGEGSGKA
jgi:epoxyqueuosine reductase